MDPRQRREARLRRRIRSVERAIMELGAGHAHPQFVGAVLNVETLADYYAAERAKGVRFVKLVVHPDLADDAVKVVEEVQGTLRGLSRLEASVEVPECGWKVAPDR